PGRRLDRLERSRRPDRDARPECAATPLPQRRVPDRRPRRRLAQRRRHLELGMLARADAGRRRRRAREPDRDEPRAPARRAVLLGPLPLHLALWLYPRTPLGASARARPQAREPAEQLAPLDELLRGRIRRRARARPAARRFRPRL